jgi:Sulfotransferase family
MQKEYRIERGASLDGSGRTALDPDEIVTAALASAGRRDFADLSFLLPLRRLIAACNAEGNLTAFGRRVVRFDVLRGLKNILELDAMEEERPEVRSRPLERPIFITGMPRSGTTFLHRLLLQEPTAAAPLVWQLVYPYLTRHGHFGARLRKLWVGAQLQLMQLIAPDLNDLHPVSMEAPEECSDLMAMVCQSSRYYSTYRVPSYLRWLETYGYRDAYRFHRRFLQHLDAQIPGRRWILKSPDHVFSLEDLRTTYPDARIVFVHRDPVRVMASVVRLTEVLRRPFARSIDRAEIGRDVSAVWIDGAERMIRAADGPEPILHLHYRQVLADPIEAARAVLRHAGRTLSAETEALMRESLRSAPKNGSAPRRYDLAMFGLDPQTLRTQFARYTERFGVALEWQKSMGSWV